MNIKLKKGKQDKQLQKQGGSIPESMLPPPMDGAENFFYKDDFLDFLLQETIINGFTIGHHILNVEADMDISFNYKKPCMVLQYMLSSHFSSSYLVENKWTVISNCCFLYRSENKQLFQHRFGAGKHHIFQIQFSFSLAEKLGLLEGKLGQVSDSRQGFLEGPIDIQKKIYFTIKQIINQSKKSNADIFYLNHRCLNLLHRFVKDLSASQRLSHWINQKQPELQKFKEEIDNNISDPLVLRSMLPSLVKKMNVSFYQFDKISKQFFGMTMPAYIKLKRMEKAMELLIKTSTPIGDVGILVGYEEFSTFSRAFIKFFGKSPSFYRL